MAIKATIRGKASADAALAVATLCEVTGAELDDDNMPVRGVLSTAAIKDAEANVLSAADAKRFAFDGAEYPLADMLASNADDSDVCYWMQRCEVGDTFDGDLTRIA